MKIESRVLAAIVMALFCATVASGTVTNVSTGPITCSVDSSVLCNNISVSEPRHYESGEGIEGAYTLYGISTCRVWLEVRKYDEDKFNLTEPYDTSYINDVLLDSGVDKDTINVSAREIDSQTGVEVISYIPKDDITLYTIGFYLSPKSCCEITVTDNYTVAQSIIKTIHVTDWSEPLRVGATRSAEPKKSLIEQV